MKENYKHLQPVWVKAALLGSLWGSVEIIVGSFLHNLRVPFSGTILSAIGISILIAGYKLWNHKGLIWRAGVVCALMKSISPSAVIIGPMIGILSEAFVLELFIRTTRGTTIGLMIGGMATSCLPFIQNIINLIITYGFNITTLYVETYRIAAKNIGIKSLDAYDVIIIFLGVNALLGFLAVLIGSLIGRKIVDEPLSAIPHVDEKYSLWEIESSQRFSIGMLIFTLVIIPVILYAVSSLAMLASFALVAIYVVIMILLYPSIWKRFSRTKLWIELIFITVLAGFVLGKVAESSSGGTWNGIATGFQMSIRAMFMIVAFSVVGIESRNPVIINWIMKKGFGQIGSSVEIAFEALPMMTATLGNQRQLFHHPVKSLSHMFSIAKQRVDELSKSIKTPSRIYFLTGSQGTGKTKLLVRLVDEFKNKNIPVSGILSLVVYENSKRLGYDVKNIETNETMPLCRNHYLIGQSQIGDFYFSDRGLDLGRHALEDRNVSNSNLVIIDEVGPLELKGDGWASSLDQLIGESSKSMLIIVRESIIDVVKRRWNIRPEIVWNLNSMSSEKIILEILNQISNHINSNG